jgi:outer membrane receptor protein involved in Fe transport
MLAAGALQAQQPRDSSVATDSARRADSLRRAQPRLATVVVTGTRLSAVDERTPSQVEQLDLSRATTGPTAAIDALLQLPGVTVFDDFGARLQPELQVRGFTVSPIVGSPQGVGVFLNGVRMNEPDAQEVNFDLLPVAAIDRASLVRGSNVLFGRNSLGGTILLTTRRGGDTPEATVELGGGSFGEQLATVTAGGKVAGIDAFIAASGSNEVGWRQATSSNTRNIFATVGYQWGPSHERGDIALDFLYGHDKIHEAGSLPESYIQADPRINYTPGDFFAPEAYGLTLRGNQPVAGGVVRATLWGRRNNYEQFNVNVPTPNTDEYIYNLSGGATTEWTRPMVIGTIPVGFTVGLEYERDNVHFRLLDVGGGAPAAVATLADVRQENAAFYTQAIVTVLPQMDITGGLRGDYIHIPFRDDQTPSNSGTNTYNRLSPEIGLTYRFTDDLKGFLAYKSGLRAPAPLELACASATAPCSLPSALGADPSLKPVTSNDYEGGFDIEVSSRTNLDVDAFWTDVNNDIQIASPDLTHVYFVNVPKTRRAGVEASGQIGLPAGVRLFGSYSYVAATFQSTARIATSDTNPQPARPGDLFPSSPLHRGRVGAGITRSLGPLLVDGEIDLKGYSSQYLRGDESNQRPQIPGYTVAGLRGRIEYRRYGVEFQIDNLFNRQYSTFGIEAQNILGPVGSTGPPVTNAPVEPFLTPSFPRRFTVMVSARI